MLGFNQEIIACRACPRLVQWREQVAKEKRKAFRDDTYWGKPVPNFGDPNATRLIVGLAPAAHGANRTGRMFTGDRSGDWLYRALYKAGVATQPTSVLADDGLHLTGVLVTAVIHCAPPGNKPLPSEFTSCRPFLERTLASRQWTSILCLGSIAWSHTLRALGERNCPFGHGKVEFLYGPGGEGRGVEVQRVKLVGSYHPSQQNTFTGKLTEDMLDAAIREFLSDR